MGQEIATHSFTEADFERFQQKLREETELLRELFESRSFSSDHGVGGVELEAWLVDRAYKPAPINAKFLEELNNPMICAELANFNIEFNNHPQRLTGTALSAMKDDIENTWKSCAEKSEEMGASLVMIGILPTATNDELVPDNMSRMKRYRALNDQVMAGRRGRPFEISIKGREKLEIKHASVMLEAATTALQLQLQVSFENSLRFYNAGLVMAAPMVAATANSPYFLGKNLWDETRIPVFEQSLAELGTPAGGSGGPNRVTLGQDFARESLFEIFHENLESYNVLLPMVYEDEAEYHFQHLRLHNGTIWRWNRPLIGFSKDGSHHLRIEHRVAPSGPTIVDIIANAAFFFGLAESLGTAKEPPESSINFAQTCKNFYAAARDGLDARIKWINGKTGPIKELVLEILIPQSRAGLLRLGLDKNEIEGYLKVFERRVATGRNGAAWQRAYVEKHGCGMSELLAAYMERQGAGAPVHEWGV